MVSARRNRSATTRHVIILGWTAAAVVFAIGLAIALHRARVPILPKSGEAIQLRFPGSPGTPTRFDLWIFLGQVRYGLKYGLLLLLVTDRLSNRVAIIDHGRLLVIGTAAELKQRVGAGTVVEIELERADEPLRLAVAGLPSVREASRTDTGLRVLADSREGLLPRLVEATVPYGLRDVSVFEPTLETVFIQLTGRELRD